MSTTSNTYNTDATTGSKAAAVGQPGYLQQAYEGAASLATTAATTVSNALNSSGVTGTTADSTTQFRNQQPHVGGVGDLGTSSDADVARLPEERANPEPFTGRGAADISASNPAVSDPVNIQSRLNAREPPVPYPETGSGVGAPAETHFRNNQPHIGGVGDLGTRSDNDVARLPEERANPNPLAAAPGGTSTSTTTKAKEGVSAVKDSMKGTVHDVTQPGHSGGNTGSNHDTDHGLGMPHRESRELGGRDAAAIGTQNTTSGSANPGGAMDMGPGSYKDRQTQDVDSVPKPNASHSMDTDSSPTDSKGPTKMDKIKGSLLIAKGKLTHGQEEIEQGKNLKTMGKHVDEKAL